MKNRILLHPHLTPLVIAAGLLKVTSSKDLLRLKRFAENAKEKAETEMENLSVQMQHLHKTDREQFFYSKMEIQFKEHQEQLALITSKRCFPDGDPLNVYVCALTAIFIIQAYRQIN